MFISLCFMCFLYIVHATLQLVKKMLFIPLLSSLENLTNTFSSCNKPSLFSGVARDRGPRTRSDKWYPILWCNYYSIWKSLENHISRPKHAKGDVINLLIKNIFTHFGTLVLVVLLCTSLAGYFVTIYLHSFLNWYVFYSSLCDLFKSVWNKLDMRVK